MEKVRGNYQQRLDAQQYLGELRSTLPYDEFSKKTTNTRFDIWMQGSEAEEHVNVNLFKEMVTTSELHIRRNDPNFRILPYDRYTVGIADPADIDTGGFNSRYSRGFKYLANAGYAALLNERYTKNPNLVTTELARSYLHDSIHAASFRTIRVLPEGANSKFPVYREQYGLNFRHANGLSYSAPHTADESPEHINLGVLMDGVTVLMTAEELRPYTANIPREDLNEVERTILADIELDIDHLPDTYKGKGFHEQVTIPSQKFIAEWGGNQLYALLKSAMLTGKLRDIVKYFDNKTCATNKWGKLFKASSY